jgi:hypothetical protein
MISGAMPNWRQYFHRIAGGFMCFLFVCLGALSVRFLANAPHRGILIPGVLFVTMAALSIGMQVWFHQRMISEFAFDGRSFQFRTLGRSRRETRELSDITAVRDWRGRGGQFGYRLVFRDGARAYLEYSVSNSMAVAEQLRLHTRE